MNLTRITRQTKEIKVADELRGVDPAAVTGVDVALVVPRTAPDALTVWTPADYLNGVATILLAGPDASPVGALVVPGTVDLWVRALAGDQVLVRKVERTTVEGGGASLPTAGSYVTTADLAGILAPLSADPSLSDFNYDPVTGNLLSYKENGITITMTYNADGTVATSKRGDNPAQIYSYSGGNLVGIA